MKNKQLVLYLFFMFWFIMFSCKIHNEQNYIVKELMENNEVDLGIFVNNEYDYLIILDEGASLKQYGIIKGIEKDWLGQKIIFFKDEKIIKQINLSYYVSEPSEKNYLSFFYQSKPGEYYIKREKGNSIFRLVMISKINNDTYCFYLK